MAVFGIYLLCIVTIVAMCKTMDEPNIDDQIGTILKLLRDKSSEYLQLESTLNQVLREVRSCKSTEALDDMKTRLLNMEERLSQQQTDSKNVEDELAEVNKLLAKMEAQESLRSGRMFAGGSTYVRWGRTACPKNGTAMIYEGYAAGGHYGHAGTSPSMLCLPSDPEWGNYNDGLDSPGELVYGVEYNVEASRSETIFGRNMRDLDVPCAACESERGSLIMIPGRTTCYGGWSMEYTGYLMAGHYGHTAQGDYHCIDGEPEAVGGGAADQNGYLLYFVEIRCRSLRCPPYIIGRELPCVVCTK